MKLMGIDYGGHHSSGDVVSISGGTVVVQRGASGYSGVLAWKVKGYK